MADYIQGKIYKIVSDECDAVYYGSTVKTLMERWQKHKYNFKSWKKIGGSMCASFKLFDEHGIDNFRIELVEDYPCDNDEQLRMKEDEYIRENECVNENRAFTTNEEKLEQSRQYHHSNKAHANENRKQRYHNHSKEELELKKEYYCNHKEAILEQRRLKVVCECGREVRKSDIARHRKSAFHQAYLNLPI